MNADNNTRIADDPAALSCWKDIARYLGKGVRTVQRWERDFGLPVRRPGRGLENAVKSPVVADRTELQLWFDSCWVSRGSTKRVRSVGPSEIEGALEQLDDRIEELNLMLREAQAQRRELMRR